LEELAASAVSSSDLAEGYMPAPIPKKYPNPRPKAKARNRERRERNREMRSERRGALRERAMARAAGLCEWAECGAQAAHMAHIEGIGRGGDPTGKRDDLDNVAMLCVYHHDLLDGRTAKMRLREIEVLLKAYITGKGH